MAFPKEIWLNDSWEGIDVGDPDHQFDDGDEVGVYQLVAVGTISSKAVVVDARPVTVERTDPASSTAQTEAKP